MDTEIDVQAKAELDTLMAEADGVAPWTFRTQIIYGCTMHDNGMDIPQDLTQPQAYEVAQFLGNVRATLTRANSSLQWAVVDLMRYAKGRWGEMYVQIAEATGYDMHSLMTMDCAGDTFTNGPTHPELPFAYHADVSSKAIPDDVRKELLDRARDEGWKRSELRRQKDALLHPLPPGYNPERVTALRCVDRAANALMQCPEEEMAPILFDGLQVIWLNVWPGLKALGEAQAQEAK